MKGGRWIFFPSFLDQQYVSKKNVFDSWKLYFTTINGKFSRNLSFERSIGKRKILESKLKVD